MPYINGVGVIVILGKQVKSDLNFHKKTLIQLFHVFWRSSVRATYRSIVQIIALFIAFKFHKQMPRKFLAEGTAKPGAFDKLKKLIEFN